MSSSSRPLRFPHDRVDALRSGYGLAATLLLPLLIALLSGCEQPTEIATEPGTAPVPVAARDQNVDAPACRPPFGDSALAGRVVIDQQPGVFCQPVGTTGQWK